MTLQDFFTEHKRCALGFSGGVDSSYLLYAAVAAGADIRPYFIKTPFQPEFELSDALRLGRELDVSITVLHAELPQTVLDNPGDRCYRCKHALFGVLSQCAAADGYTTLIDGTNASDDPADRPGMRALAELQVLSPLRLCGLTKSDIRILSREAGLFTWNKPAYACLATRFPTGTLITPSGLDAVERAEGLLFRLGFSDFRVRVFHDTARIQLPGKELERLLYHRDTILQEMKKDFTGVLLDLEGRP